MTEGTTGTVRYAIKKKADADFSVPQAENIFSNLTSGTYIVAVYDNVSTTLSGDVVLNNTPYTPMVVSGTPTTGNPTPTCCDPDGSITIKLTTSKGNPPFTYHLKGGPTSKPDIIGTGGYLAWEATFTQLETGTYSIDITDACGNTITSSNIAVTSKYNFSGVTFGSLDGMGGSKAEGTGCDVSISFSTDNILLKDIGNNVLFQRSVNHMPRTLPIEVRVEYPAASGIYTPWQSVFGSFALPDYKPDINTYRVEMRNPCNAGNVVVSPVYTIGYPFVSKSGFCTPSISRATTGYDCGTVGILLTRTGSSKSYTWNGSGLSYTLDLSGLSGTYAVFITVNGSTYQTTDIKTGTPSSVTVSSDTYNYTCTNGCDFTTGTLRSYLSGWPADNTLPISYTIVSGPTTRDPVTSTQALTPIWGDLPAGIYSVRVDYSDCRTETKTNIKVNPPFGGFMADELSYIAGSSCGKYKITGKGWYLAPDSTVSTSTTQQYYAALFNSAGVAMTGTGVTTTAINNNSFTISYEVAPGTYKVKMVNAGNSKLVCWYLERTIIIPPYTPIKIDVNTSGGVVCDNGYGELHVGIAGGSGQTVTYRIKSATDPDVEASYSPYQTSPDFSNLPAGNYTVQVQDGGCGSAKQNLTLVAGATVSHIDVSGSACQGSDAVLSLRVVGRASDIEWTRPTGGKLLGQAVTVKKLTLADAGKYLVRFSSGGCTWKDSVTLVVNPKPEFTVKPDNVGCQAVDLRNLPIVSGNISGLSMTFFNAAYQPIADPSQTGTGIYRIVGATAFGCKDTSTVSVTVKTTAVADNITATALKVCTDSIATVQAKTEASSGIVNPVFRWYASQTSTDILAVSPDFTTQKLTAHALRDTVFYVSVSGDNYCENLPDNRKEVRVTVQPRHTVHIQTAQSADLCHNNTISLHAVTNGNAIWYGWYDSKGELKDNPTQFAPNPRVADVVYNPDPSETGKKIKLIVRVRDAVCGYEADTIRLQILPLPHCRETRTDRLAARFSGHVRRYGVYRQGKGRRTGRPAQHDAQTRRCQRFEDNRQGCFHQTALRIGRMDTVEQCCFGRRRENMDVA